MPPGKYGGELVLSTTTDPKSFNSIIAKETSTTAVTGFLFEGLTRINGLTTEVELSLANTYKKSKDNLNFIFSLRKGVKWFDGRPFTSSDVVFTYNSLVYNPDIPTSSRDIFTLEGKHIKVEAIGPDKVRFTLPFPFAPLLYQLSQEILPKHILEKSVRNGTFNSTWGIDTPPSEIIGTGAFKLSEYIPGEKIVLLRNPLYWGKDKDGNKLPYIDKIILLIVPDQNSQILRFLRGEIDALSIRGQDYYFLKKQEKRGNFTIYDAGPSLGSNFLAFNQNPDSPIPKKKLKWFKDKKFRAAIAYAIDKQSIIENVYAGFGYNQDGPLNKSSGFFYNPNIEKYKYNLKKSLDLLEEAGFKKRGSQLFDKEGNLVEFNLFTNSDNNERVEICNIIKDDLKKIGIKVHFLGLDFNNLVTRLSSTLDWEAILIGLTGGIEPHSGKNVWHSSGQLHLWYPLQKRPETSWEAEIDKIFEKGAREMDRKKRKVLYDRWQEIISQEVPLIYTVNSSSLYAVRNKFGNLKPSAFGGIFHNIEEIYIKRQ